MGHGLHVSIRYEPEGEILNVIQFSCHPDSAGYDQLRAMSTEQLISLAKVQLESGALDESLAQARANGFVLIVRLEASD